MKALRYHGRRGELCLEDVPRRDPGPGQVRVAVSACGVCRTDLHLVDDELEEPALPIVPGHEIVGHIAKVAAMIDSPDDQVDADAFQQAMHDMDHATIKLAEIAIAQTLKADLQKE